jgi:hypothetical protein
MIREELLKRIFIFPTGKQCLAPQLGLREAASSERRTDGRSG